MAFCPNCGKPFDGVGKFCSGCGAPMNTAPQQPVTPQPVATQTVVAQQPVSPQYNNVPQYNAAPNYNAPQQNYAAQNFTPAANIARTPVKTDYSLLMYILLTILTLGIYGLIVIYNLAKDTNQMCAEDGDKVGGLCAYFFLTLLTFGIYSIYWFYKVQTRIHNAAPRYGAVIPEDGGTVMLWTLLGMFLFAPLAWYAMHIVFKSANTLGTAYNAKYFGR